MEKADTRHNNEPITRSDGTPYINNPSTHQHSLRTGRDMAIYQMHLDHQSYRQIAGRLGLSKSQVGEILTNPERLRQLAVSTAAHLYSLLPLAPPRLRQIISSGTNNEAIAAIRLLLEATGIARAHTSSQTVVNVLQQVFAEQDAGQREQSHAVIRDLIKIRHQLMDKSAVTEIEIDDNSR